MQVPAGYELSLSAIIFVDGVSEFYVVCEAAHGLRIRVLEAVGVGCAFGAARAGVSVGGTVVGDGVFGEVVPELAGGTFAEVRVRVGEEGGVYEGFLRLRLEIEAFTKVDLAHCVISSCPLPLPQ